MIYLGTCSWKYPSWKGVVYQGSDRKKYLSEYSGIYNSVEIDQWFWSLFGSSLPKMPDPIVAAEYAGSVPENFKFTIKVPNSLTLTHYYNYQNPEKNLTENKWFLSEELFSEFLKSIEPLKKNLGVLIFQFEYINKKKIPSKEQFFTKLEKFFSNIRKTTDIAIELRNSSWIDEQYFNLLDQIGASHVLSQGYYMDDIRDIYNNFNSRIKETSVIRLLGRDRKGIEKLSGNKWDRRIIPQESELKDIASIIDDLERRGIKVFVNINNHYEGSAPLTIKRLQEILSEIRKT